MKTFENLTEAQQAKAVEHFSQHLLTEICEGTIRFNDELNGDNLQARIDTAWEKAEAMQTPWFAGSYIWDTCQEDIESMARSQAEDSIYPEAGEHCAPSTILA